MSATTLLSSKLGNIRCPTSLSAVAPNSLTDSHHHISDGHYLFYRDAVIDCPSHVTTGDPLDLLIISRRPNLLVALMGTIATRFDEQGNADIPTSIAMLPLTVTIIVSPALRISVGLTKNA